VAYGVSTDWADIQLPKLNEIENILPDFKKGFKMRISRSSTAIRVLNYLSLTHTQYKIIIVKIEI
jgi:erythromycin esterase